MSSRAETIMVNSGKALSERVDDLDQATERVEDRLQLVTDELQSTLTEVMTASDTGSSKIREVVDKLRAGASALDSAGRNARSEVNNTGNLFAEQSNQLTSGADKAARLLSLVTEVMTRQAGVLEEATERVQIDLDMVSKNFKERSDELDALSERTAEKLSVAEGGLQDTAGQLESVS